MFCPCVFSVSVFRLTEMFSLSPAQSISMKISLKWTLAPLRAQQLFLSNTQTKKNKKIIKHAEFDNTNQHLHTLHIWHYCANSYPSPISVFHTSEYVPSDNLLVCAWFISIAYENPPARTWNTSEHNQHGPFVNNFSLMSLLNKICSLSLCLSELMSI